MYHDWLTVLVLFFPVPIPERACPVAWDSLRRVSEHLELVGPHERWRTHYRDEVGYCRQHLWCLTDAPSIHDRHLLPSRETAQERVALLGRCISALKCSQAISLHRHREYELAIQARRADLDLWQSVANVQGDFAWAHRRTWLREIREQVGWTAFYRGTAP